MRYSLILTTLLSLAMTLPAQAQVYKWKDAQGRTVISDTPQPGSGKQVPVVQTPATTTPDAEEDKNKSWAEKDMELKKRQQEKKENAAKAEKEKAEAAQKQENCERAKKQKAMIDSGERLATRNAKGEREFMDDAQRQQESQRASQAVQEWCK
ncbi:DUF4124 domain-containing protein [Azovibrio restrictus]|uniref:DUF4124 domain-containing protein n=1 Tax=Azovibrio restrictus TaxID=146938 RepID=UPI0026F1482C|nr:DUF4124 domain-containing protein [Azovibrio restrictus]MDD3484602.1 DUF4124 domain-containing protein [Azovibrio restrictus]